MSTSSSTPSTPSITPGRFAGRTAIVTGAGSGIGRATAVRLAQEGARVIAAELSEFMIEAGGARSSTCPRRRASVPRPPGWRTPPPSTR